MRNRKKIIGGIVTAVIVLILLFFPGDDKKNDSGENISVKNSPAEISVYVSGQVKTPAVVTLQDEGNLRLIDAVNAAGGLTEFADSEKINLAEPLFDGQHIHVPTKEIFFGELPDEKKSSAKNFGDVVNINTADEKTLTNLPGVGPSTAKKIIEYREHNGNFKTIDDIKKVRGIGDKKFEKMKEFLAVDDE